MYWVMLMGHGKNLGGYGIIDYSTSALWPYLEFFFQKVKALILTLIVLELTYTLTYARIFKATHVLASGTIGIENLRVTVNIKFEKKKE